MTLGEQIRSAREAKNLSQEALAEYLGVSRQAVSKWENGTAVPQGANMTALIEILELDVEKEEPAPKPRGIIFWLGWVAAGVLLAALIGVLVWRLTDRHDPSVVPAETAPAEPQTTPTEILPPEKAEEKPEIVSVRFYSNTQEEAQSVMEEFLEYDTATVESILVQWTGDTPLDAAKMFFLPNNAQSPSEAELLEVKAPIDHGNAVLFSASYLHNANRKGTVYFELHFQNGCTLSSTELYRVYYSDIYTQLANVHSVEGGQLTYDKVEWVVDGSARAEELGIENTNNGFELYNEQSILESLPVSEDAPFITMVWNHPDGLLVDAKDVFLDNLLRAPVLCELVIKNGVITSVTQRYLP